MATTATAIGRITGIIGITAIAAKKNLPGRVWGRAPWHTWNQSAGWVVPRFLV